MFITFISNFFLACVSAALTARYFYSESLAYRLLAFFAFFFSQAILILMSWGLLGRLYPGNIILTAAIVFLLSRLITGKNSPGALFRLPGLSDNRVAAFVLSLLLGFGIVKIIINLVNPPFGWDSLNYHFTFPVEWLKHANLQNPITINDDLAPSYYPINGSLIYLWFILPLKNVFLADLGQVPFFAVSFLALYGLCRRLNIGREFSFYAAGLFSLTPNYFKQLEISYVDVMVCAWFLAGAYFLICFLQRRKLSDIFLFSASIGMLIGTKTIALLYGGALFLFFIVSLLRSKNKIIPYFLISVSLIILLGGYGYVRNLMDTGNPLYPMKVELLGREIFKGVYDKSNYSVRFISGDYSLSKILFHEGMGAGAIVFIIPGLLYFLYGIVRRKPNLRPLQNLNLVIARSAAKRRGEAILKRDCFAPSGLAMTERGFFSGSNFPLLAVFSLPVVLYLVWRYLIPLSNLRYLYPAIALAYIAPFYFLQAHPKLKITARVLTIICALAAAAEISSRAELVSSFVLSLALFFSFRPVYNWIAGFKAKQWLIAGASLFLLLYFLNLNYNANEFKRYPRMTKYSGLWPQACQAWKWLDENTGADNIAYVGRPVPFPLYGRNLKNNVFYVSVNETDPAMIHYFPNSRYRWGSDFLELHNNLEAEGNYRQHPDYEVWLNNLKKRKTDYLFIYSLHQTKETVFPLEDEWARNNPERFGLSFSNPTIRIYRILK